ncbi:plant UBX domain-containing protein 10-like [Magnolia sinica]|uniref:plant UBX domain-containing protein 10-like n=1 Tax=Magnolia sinica TaxID=86752 RepID=UPI002659F038|nr:plant UBX domain-containing protein 10-like [Magnolia sinica]XP_058113107.1 plant UBX domain-containing protein 10-like [Magnolia sinica]XP_058113108.1 plant UBX domain-containing protein 10-like [Magnolia sinica]
MMSIGENTRAERSSRSGIVRRIVNLPMNIIGGFSRAVDHGMALIGAGRRDYQRLHFQQPQEALAVPEEWVFITNFEQQYGLSHPFFYACRFVEALKIAEQESKLLFLYLHLPEHPYTAPFCSGTLCKELVVQFLDANFVSWAAVANRGEGLHITAALRAPTFPFCAIIMPTSGDSIVVLQQVEGPVSPAELVEILQLTLEEQTSAFRAKAVEEERRRANRQLREEQNAAYHVALQIDREKERIRDLAIEETTQLQKQVEAHKKANIQKPKKSPAATKQPGNKARETTKDNQWKETSTPIKGPMVTQIQIRFPNGERKEQSFLCTDKIQSIYRYIDSLGLPGVGSYRLISNFPRKVFGFEQMNTTLKDAGLHPSASLFLELI